MSVFCVCMRVRAVLCVILTTDAVVKLLFCREVPRATDAGRAGALRPFSNVGELDPTGSDQFERLPCRLSSGPKAGGSG